jgi:hypothetical protein
MSLSTTPAERAEAFVDAWYRAVPHDDEIDLNSEKAGLLRQIHVRPELAELFTSELLGSALCEMNQRLRGHLPTHPVEFYRMIGDGLADRRPPSSSGRPPRRGPIDQRNALLLQHLAGYMLLEDLVALERPAAVEAIAAVLPNLLVGRIEGTPEEVLDDLLHETSALTSTSAGDLEFIHPAVRNHFGTLDLADEVRLDVLVSRAHQAAWQPVIQLAAARLTRRGFTEFLEHLAERADSEPQHTRHLDLLAAICVKTKSYVDPALSSAVEERAARHAAPN